jgi:hypothetical protein
VAANVAAASTADRSAEIRDAYAATTARIVTGGQRQAAMIAAAWVASYAPVDLSHFSVDADLAPHLMAPDDSAAIVGLLRLWSLVDEGEDEAQARADAGLWAGGIAGGHVLEAERVGADAAAHATGRRPRWRKVPNDDACDWCLKVADGGFRYWEAETVPFHAAPGGGVCRCGIEPEFGE